VTTARQAIVDNTCPTDTFAADLTAGLTTLRPRGPIAASVLARVTAMLTGRLSRGVETRSATTSAEVLTALTEVAPGSTVVLAPGDYRFTDTLVLLDGVALRGAAKDTTTIHSSARDAAVVVLTGARVDLADLTLVLDPQVPASGVVAGPAATLAVSRVRITAAAAGSDGLGGAGIQMSGTGTEGSGRGTTLEVTDAQLDHNAWAGVAVGGGHRSSILRSQFTGNGQCGVCFFGTATGSVQDGTFADNTVALGATEAASPTWIGDTVTGGTIGAQIDGAATPTIQGLHVTGATRASIVYSGHSAGAITGAECRGSPFGLVVADTATPSIGTITCPVARLGKQ
jgi:hypothetical protein